MSPLGAEIKIEIEPNENGVFSDDLDLPHANLKKIDLEFISGPGGQSIVQQKRFDLQMPKNGRDGQVRIGYLCKYFKQLTDH